MLTLQPTDRPYVADATALLSLLSRHMKQCQRAGSRKGAVPRFPRRPHPLEAVVAEAGRAAPPVVDGHLVQRLPPARQGAAAERTHGDDAHAELPRSWYQLRLPHGPACSVDDYSGGSQGTELATMSDAL